MLLNLQWAYLLIDSPYVEKALTLPNALTSRA